MVSDRNRQTIERRRSGESFSAIGTALGISRERVREIFEREERREQRALELEEAARLAQQPNPLQLPPRLRNMLAKLFGTRNFTPDDVVALEYSAAMFWTIQILDCRIGKSLRRGWSVQESRLRINATAAVSIPTILDKEEHSAAYGAPSFLLSHFYTIAHPMTACILDNSFLRLIASALMPVDCSVERSMTVGEQRFGSTYSRRREPDRQRARRQAMIRTGGMSSDVEERPTAAQTRSMPRSGGRG
jgi:hypothetical protein